VSSLVSWRFAVSKPNGTIHFGTFDAEKWWRPADLAELPAVRTGGDTVVATMDEMLVAGCSRGDLLVTRRPFPPDVRQSLAEAGIEFDHVVAQGTEIPAEPIERQLFGDRVVAEIAAHYGRVQPYAVLPETEAVLAQWGISSHVSQFDVVSRVNSKTWSNSLVQTLGLPGIARLVQSVDELEPAVRDSGPTVVIKDPYGVSGRGSLRVNSPGVLRAIERVLRHQEAEGHRVEFLVQPEFAKKCDFSGHLDVAADGTTRYLGVQLMINHGFRHFGSGPAGPELMSLLDRSGYRDTLADIGAALANAGYHGPVCVDSMVLADDTVLPILEINARCSLGLLTLLAGNRIAHTGLTCHLWQLGLTLGPDQGVEHVISALRDARLLYLGGSQSGVLLLGGGSAAETEGRVYGLSYCAADDAPAWYDRVVAAVRTAGIRVRSTRHAA